MSADLSLAVLIVTSLFGVSAAVNRRLLMWASGYLAGALLGTFVLAPYVQEVHAVVLVGLVILILALNGDENVTPPVPIAAVVWIPGGYLSACAMTAAFPLPYY